MAAATAGPRAPTLGGIGISSSKEPDAALAEAIAQRGCILRGIVGSTVHGLSNAGTDDRDEMGVCIEPAEYIAGLRPFEHWVYRTQPEGAPSGPGDLDLTIYQLLSNSGRRSLRSRKAHAVTSHHSRAAHPAWPSDSSSSSSRMCAWWLLGAAACPISSRDPWCTCS